MAAPSLYSQRSPVQNSNPLKPAALPMTRIFLCTAALMLPMLTSALAQEITASERAACQVDYDKYCKGTFPGGGRIIRCLSSHYGNLADACKKVVDSKK